jgi:transposase InsO family protein
MDNVGLAAHRSGAACPTCSPTSAPFPETPSSRWGRRELTYLDNGTAYTSRGFRARLKDLGVDHRRGGYRDPESQAFIESWFSKLKERLVWRSEFETLEEARAAIAAYVETYHHRPHSGLGYRTPKEVRETWEDAQESEASTNSRGLG